MLNINPTDAVPIWKQIEDEMRRLIAIGTLITGGPVPSVRDMARDLRVNPATVAKAYQHLTDAGLLMVKRGEGTFVAESPPHVKKSERREALAAAALKYASLASTIGAGSGEAIREVEAAFEQLGNGAERRKS
ncbi:MAG TPA: GntR family transcriptional regulator [Thermoanaerobaculia bacterium]